MAEIVVADFWTERPKLEWKPNKMLKSSTVNSNWKEEVFWGFFYTVVFQECHSSVRPNELEQWSAELDLYSSRAGQSALFDGAADIKQLPLWAALRKRCYRSMGHTLVTQPNSFSTLSKQRLLCIYLHRELVLHNSIELLNSICVLIYRLVGGIQVKGKFDYTVCGLGTYFASVLLE